VSVLQTTNIASDYAYVHLTFTVNQAYLAFY